jgi:hypothetical protein
MEDETFEIELSKAGVLAARKLFHYVTEDDLYKFGYTSDEIEALGELFLELKSNVETIEMMEG